MHLADFSSFIFYHNESTMFLFYQNESTICLLLHSEAESLYKSQRILHFSMVRMISRASHRVELIYTWGEEKKHVFVNGNWFENFIKSMVRMIRCFLASAGRAFSLISLFCGSQFLGVGWQCVTTSSLLGCHVYIQKDIVKCNYGTCLCL